MADDLVTPDDGDTTDFPFQTDSDISPEEREEVIAQIDAVAQENRIKVTPDLLRVQSGSSGALFPVLVNAVGLLVLLAGLGAGLVFFRRNEADLTGQAGTFKTAEGRLIAVLRREAEEQIEAKDNEIKSMQARLSDVAAERDQILDEIDDRVRTREEELRKSLVEELQAERQRLLAAGQSRSQVDTRIGSLEVQREREIEAEISVLRAGLEQEWERQLSGLKVVQAEYESSLSQLEKQRLAIAAESRVREQALRKEAEAQSAARAALAEQTQEARQATLLAEQALKDLSARVEQEALVQSQINGFYGQIVDDVARLDYDAALVKIGGIRGLFDDPRFLALPGVQDRVRIDMFLTDSLIRLISDQRQSQKIDLASLTAAAGAIAELRGAVQEARSLAQSGRAEDATLRYRQALGVLPEASEAYGFLKAQQDAALEIRLAAFGASRLQANRAFADGDYRAALQGYATALIAGAGTQVPAQDVLGQIQASAGRIADQASKTAVDQAQVVYQRQLVLEVQAAQATTRQQMETEFDRRLAAMRSEDEEGTASVTPGATSDSPWTGGAPVSSPQAAAMLATADAYVAQRRYSDAMDTYLSLIRAYPGSVEVSSAASGVAAAAKALVDRNDSEIAELKDSLSSLENETARLAPFEGREAGLRQLYRDYTAEEDRILGDQGDRGLATAQLALQAFLTSQHTEELMPGLWERTQRYQNAFEREGRQIAILETIDIVYNLASQESGAEKRAFLDTEAEQNKGNEFLVQFIEELRYLVEEG